MFHHDLTFDFHCCFYNGWPTISLEIDGRKSFEHQFSQSNEKLCIKLPAGSGKRKLSIVRTGKTDRNIQIDTSGKIVQDQTLEIKYIKINGTVIPDYIFRRHSRFEFENQVHPGSMWFGPNGVWTFEFQEPLITWLLEEKIYHESNYNKDYLHAWAYKLGPNSVNEILDKINLTRQKIERLDLE